MFRFKLLPLLQQQIPHKHTNTLLLSVFFFYNQIIGDNMSIISINCILIYWMEMYKKARTNTLNILEFDSNCVQNKTKQNKKNIKIQPLTLMHAM